MNKHASKAIDRLRLLGTYGSNKVMDGELSRLARRAFEEERFQAFRAHPAVKLGPGALGYPFSSDLAALAATYHRTSARALWDLYELKEHRLEPLYETLRALIEQEERPIFHEGVRTISVEAFSELPIEAGQRQIIGTVKNAIVDGARHFGLELSVDARRADLVFHVRGGVDASGESITLLSLDIAGRPLHERGYRTESGEAPLREDLAALLLMLARFDPRRDVLVDPMAGSGTIVTEAALMALGRPIWTSGRGPLLARHPILTDDFQTYGAPLFGDAKPIIFSREVDPEVASLTERALETAGVRRFVEHECLDFRDDLPEPILTSQKERGAEGGLILTNPPYGVRLEYSESELLDLYRALADYARGLPGFRTALLVGEPEENDGSPRIRLVEKAFGGKPRVHKPLMNGPLRASFLLYDPFS